MPYTFTGDLISLGANFDHTEKIHRHTLPTFDTNPTFSIKHQNNATSDYHLGTLFWISPDHQVPYIHRDFKVNMTKKFELLQFKPDDPTLSNGLWTVVYLDFLQKVHQIEFLMVGHPTATQYKSSPLFNHEKTIVQAALEKRPNDQQAFFDTHFVHAETCIVNDNCEVTDWSSKSPDPFGTIDMTMPEWMPPTVEDIPEEPVVPKPKPSNVLHADDYDLEDEDSELVNLDYEE